MNRTKGKSEGEWKAKTLATHAIGKSVEWKAQLVKSPDNKRFVSVKQFIKKADGSEIVGKGGIMLSYDDDTVKNLKEIRKLFRAIENEIAPADSE